MQFEEDINTTTVGPNVQDPANDGFFTLLIEGKVGTAGRYRTRVLADEAAAALAGKGSRVTVLQAVAVCAPFQNVTWKALVAA